MTGSDDILNQWDVSSSFSVLQVLKDVDLFVKFVLLYCYLDCTSILFDYSFCILSETYL